MNRKASQRREDIILILRNRQPIKSDDSLGVTMDLAEFFPQGYITTTKMKSILRQTQDPVAIADCVLEPPKEAPRKQREDAYGIGRARLSDRYKGRKPGKEYETRTTLYL